MSTFLHEDLKADQLKNRTQEKILYQEYESPIKAIELIFENVEGLYLKPNVIKSLIIDDVNQKFSFINNSNRDNKTKMRVSTVAKDIFIKFDKKQLMDINNHNVTHMHQSDEITLANKKAIKEHMVLVKQHIMDFRDIVAIQVIYEDQTQETIDVHWDDRSDYVNYYAIATEDDEFIELTIREDNKQINIDNENTNTLHNKSMALCQWFEVANFLETGDIDDIYYTLPDDKPDQLKKLTTDTQLPVASLSDCTWYVLNE